MSAVGVSHGDRLVTLRQIVFFAGGALACANYAAVSFAAAPCCRSELTFRDWSGTERQLAQRCHLAYLRLASDGASAIIADDSFSNTTSHSVSAINRQVTTPSHFQ